MELSLSLLFAFGLRPALAKLPAGPRRALLFLLLALAAEQTANLRQQSRRTVLVPTDETRTVEYRALHLRGGSESAWRAGHVARIDRAVGQRFFRCSTVFGQLLEHGLQQHSTDRAEFGVRRRRESTSPAWFEGFRSGRAQQCGSPAPDSQGGIGKAFLLQPAPSSKRVLPVLWRGESGVTIYRIPQRSTSLAHVVPEAALVAHAPANGDDTMEIERYATALDDPLLPGAEFPLGGKLTGIRIRAATLPGQAILDSGVPRPTTPAGLHARWRP